MGRMENLFDPLGSESHPADLGVKAGSYKGKSEITPQKIPLEAEIERMHFALTSA